MKSAFKLIFCLISVFLGNLCGEGLFSKKAQIGELWRVLDVVDPDNFYIIYDVPENITAEPYWENEKNIHVSLKKFPLEIDVRKVGISDSRRYYLIDIYSAHRFNPEMKKIVASGWLPSWLVKDAERIIDESRSKVLEGITFAVNSHKITKFPDKIIERIKKEQNLYENVKLVIEGYTDNMGEEEYNLNLSILRAKSVADFIMSKTGLSPKQISYIGYGESQPAADNETEEGRAVNRRIEMRMYR